ncbi:MAG: hypothetical protein LBJ59_08495 [Zoogloeaceae bacterium]|jgi:hypothetical protein|nr:hypothetical protein [Zoogloeaceae bacterium]
MQSIKVHYYSVGGVFKRIFSGGKMRIDTNGLFDVSLSHRRNLAFLGGVWFLSLAIMDLIYGRSWIMEGRLRWLGNFLVEIFGNHGTIGFEFLLAFGTMYQGLICTLKLKNGGES